jgi:hypothetical protein
VSLPDRDPDLEADFPRLLATPYSIKSDTDPRYNCVAFAVGDLGNFWYDIKVNGYYWPPNAPSADSLDGWVKVFTDHGYRDTEDSSLEPEFEKIAIYETDNVPEHVARQKASGVWISKMGTGHDIEHTIESLEGGIAGDLLKIMKRPCMHGRRVLE